jgi:hypothetical protein
MISTIWQDCEPVPWFQRFIFIIFIAKGRGKIDLWLKAAIDSLVIDVLFESIREL